MATALRTRAFAPRNCRAIHSSLVRRNLVGPPDPISHLRPVIYDDAPPPPPSDVRHPYSLREFTGDTREYQWKMQRQDLDTYNHAFWTDTNSRFQAAKQALLDSLPEACTPLDKEFALSDFYVSWVKQEAERQAEYDRQWRKRNWSNILLGAKLRYKRLFRISEPSREDVN
ncbi:hypothetical protein NM688_g7292 [Phlebia brevispora]|uniref:Uncharacterized protein n=1 Tax=Phlebia brevispora TaxID=194682 RepID=A0ACC1S6U2_9APHY|nr:hypothetical protein NM688_g7292 [Phlebia brevispora]